MKPDRASLWIRMFAELVVVWPFLEPTKDRVRVWDAALSDLGEEQVREGVARLIANHGAPTPTPGELRDAVLGPLTWETVRHQVDGRVMGKRQVRTLAREELPAPRALVDLDRATLALPGQAGALVKELAAGMSVKNGTALLWTCQACGYSRNKTGVERCGACGREAVRGEVKR